MRNGITLQRVAVNTRWGSTKTGSSYLSMGDAIRIIWISCTPSTGRQWRPPGTQNSGGLFSWCCLFELGQAETQRSARVILGGVPISWGSFPAGTCSTGPTATRACSILPPGPIWLRMEHKPEVLKLLLQYIIHYINITHYLMTYALFCQMHRKLNNIIVLKKMVIYC